MSFFKSIHDFLHHHPEKIKNLVFTNGCFDLLHIGHVRYLQTTKAYGDHLIVGLNSDFSVKRLKGNSRPVNKESDRAEMLLALSCVNDVILFDEDTPVELIKALKPEVIAKGGDYKKTDIIGADIVESYGGKVIILPFEKGYSTTNIIERISINNKEGLR